MKNKCKKYGIAITDFVLGEEMDITRKELFNHLRKCADCRADLSNWQTTYAALRTEAYHKTPEAKKRMEELWEKIKNLPASPSHSELPPLCLGVKVDETQRKALEEAKKKIFLASGKVCQFLKINGATPLMELRQGTGLINKPFYETMGWLTMNEIVVPTAGKKTETIYALTNTKG